MKILNIVGWTIIAGLCLAAPLIDSLIVYSIAYVGLMLMTVISMATTYDDIDKEIMDELNSK